MAIEDRRTGRADGRQGADGRIDVERLVDCGPVEGLTDAQKDAAQVGLEAFLAEYRERHPTAAVPDNPTTSAVVAGLASALGNGAATTGPSIDVGERRRDRERDGEEVVVVATHDVAAEEYGVLATHQTVAEHNPEYPPTDRVIEAAYVESVGPAEEIADMAAAGEIEAADLQTYAFPESRLTPVEEDGR